MGDEGNTPLCPGGRAESNNLKDHEYTACDCGNLIDSPDGHLGVGVEGKGMENGRRVKAADHQSSGQFLLRSGSGESGVLECPALRNCFLSQRSMD